MNLNIKARQQNTYDAIVVGTGVSGGWAAKELTEKGLKTLVLERGRMVEHIRDYPTMNKAPWELPYNDHLPEEELKDYQVQNRTDYTIRQSLKHWWVKDTEHPYEEIKPFSWIRGYHLGGRSLLWGRVSLRLSDLDFEANAKEGIGVDWPIRYKDLEPWYDYVERFAGINGEPFGLDHQPDGNWLPPMELNCLEDHVRQKVEAKYPDRRIRIAPKANLTQNHNGRAACNYRNLCMRGCPFGAYFSTQSATLPAATATGNMTLRADSIVTEVLYDPDSQKATGIRVLDAVTGEYTEYYSKIVFLNASTLGTTWILLNSTEHFPNGMGNASDALGRNLMDHQLGIGAGGVFEGFEDKYYYGRRPTGVYIPRFRNVTDKHPDFIRGYGYQGSASRQGWQGNIPELSIGEGIKEELATPGPWRMGIGAFGECLPYHDNRVTLTSDKLDIHGLPTFKIDMEFKENEKAMVKDMQEQAVAMLEAGGLKDISTYNDERSPGLGIHEMGTARMGRDPKTSVCNEWNQLHEVKNVFVTDGACMTSSGCQNPSLTYMALTARAADFAVNELKRGNL